MQRPGLGETAIGAADQRERSLEVILNAMAMFNHANIVLPAQGDRVLRWIIVTPADVSAASDAPGGIEVSTQASTGALR
ncbi:MAG: hypothetical protein K9L88_21020 [Chromatiaceae bacterium]|jgi:hypothetical protein|nr:hypothetical protein [Chromatiaceae bacterium]